MVLDEIVQTYVWNSHCHNHMCVLFMRSVKKGIVGAAQNEELRGLGDAVKA